MVAATPCHVRGRLRQRSGPEPIGCTAESNQPYVLPLGADDTGSQIAGPDTGGPCSPAMRASCVLRVRLRKDKHTARAKAILTYSACPRQWLTNPRHNILTMRPNGLTGI